MKQPYPAELYAALHVGNPGDVTFYREWCRGADRVLELGCGYGRMLEALAREDLALLGLDADRALLTLAQQRLQRVRAQNVRLVQGDMRRFAFAQPFDRILIPYSAIYCLLDLDDLAACLRHVAAHLRPEGRFIFDAYSADAFHEAADDPDELEGGDLPDDVGSVVYEGVHYHVTEQTRWWRDEQRMDVVYVHEPREGGATIATPLQHRYLLSHQVEPLLDAAGMTLVSLAGDYEGTPFSSESDLMTVVAKLR